jgi:hypothetical protein
MTRIQAPDTTGTIELVPDYRLPLILVVLSIPLLFFLPWLGAPCSLFGLFLALQTATVRLQFTPLALDVYRSGKRLRSFPYREWDTWRIFWSPVPLLFYFRESRSIHFLPVLFDPRGLRECLEKYFPSRE